MLYARRIGPLGTVLSIQRLWACTTDLYEKAITCLMLQIKSFCSLIKVGAHHCRQSSGASSKKHFEEILYTPRWTEDPLPIFFIGLGRQLTPGGRTGGTGGVATGATDTLRWGGCCAAALKLIYNMHKNIEETFNIMLHYHSHTLLLCSWRAPCLPIWLILLWRKLKAILYLFSLTGVSHVPYRSAAAEKPLCPVSQEISPEVGCVPIFFQICEMGQKKSPGSPERSSGP